ncbi:TIL domain-containing protein, partial [Trichonephila clavata]
PDCPANKTYGSFGDCPPSCYSLQHPVRACTLKLNYGCMCEDDYVLLKDKVFSSPCVKPDDCPN